MPVDEGICGATESAESVSDMPKSSSSVSQTANDVLVALLNIEARLLGVNRRLAGHRLADERPVADSDGIYGALLNAQIIAKNCYRLITEIERVIG